MFATRRSAHCRPPAQSGFTLLELAIVLVVIGLLIGGVLVGQDLIKAAEIRATVTQIERYNAAVNTFRTRFKSMPGDIKNITRFFGADYTDVVNGNGNGQLEQCDTAGLTCTTAYQTVDGTIFNGEIVQFWRHLTVAELVNGAYNGHGYDAADPLSGALHHSFPASKMDRNGIGVFASAGVNFYQIGLVSAADHPTAGAYGVAASLTPEEAFKIDSKLDDGMPGAGIVLARGAQAGALVNAAWAAPDVGGGVQACIEESVAPGDTQAERKAHYALSSREVTCSLRLKMS